MTNYTLYMSRGGVYNRNNLINPLIPNARRYLIGNNAIELCNSLVVLIITFGTFQLCIF